MNRLKCKQVLLAIIMALIIFFSACSFGSTDNLADNTPGSNITDNKGNKSDDTIEDTVYSPDDELDNTVIPTESEKPKGSTSIRIRAVGDIMMHSPQIPAGLKDDGTYDFKFFFEEVKPYLEDVDITVGNFESTIGDGSLEYTGYPLFRSPKELIEALKYAGFDVLTTANNHSFDGREFGVTYTLDQMDAYNILHTGTARSMEERNQVLIVEKKGIKVAILAYTYGTNGMEVTISEEKLAYMVNYIDRDLIKEDIKRAKEAGADAIVVSIHWGNEYQRTPDNNQKEMANFLFSQGVDVILGSHPHVLQPMEKRKVTTEDGTEKEVFVIYSLGNFISNQYWRYSDCGVIIDVEIIKNYDTGEVMVGNISYIPTYVQRIFLASGKREYRVLPAGRYKDDSSLSSAHSKRINEVWNETIDHIGGESFTVIP